MTRSEVRGPQNTYRLEDYLRDAIFSFERESDINIIKLKTVSIAYLDSVLSSISNT